MSAIGDYIHLSWAGYKGYSNIPKTLFDTQDVKDVYSKQRQRITSYINQNLNSTKLEAAKEYETKLNNFASYMKDGNNDTTAIKTTLEEAFKSAMGSDTFDQYVIDWSSLEATSKDFEGLKKGRRYQTEKGQGYIKPETIRRILDNLKDRYKKLVKIDNPDKDLKEYVDALKKFWKILNGLVKQAEQADKNSGWLKTRKKDDKIIGYAEKMIEALNKNDYTVPGKEGNITLLSALNYLMNYSPNYLQSIGAAAETTAAYVGVSMAQKAEDVSAEAVKAAIVGYKKGKVTYKSANNKLKKGVLKNIKNQKAGDKELFSINSIETQDKVDVTLNFQYGLETVEMNLSVKNSNYGSKIHLVSGTSLYTILKDENPDFINQYLNMSISHIAFPNSFSGTYMPNWPFLLTAQRNYNELITNLILIKSMSGHNISKEYSDGVGLMKEADFLVINRRKLGGNYPQWQVYYIPHLIKQICGNNFQGLKIYINDKLIDLQNPVYFSSRQLYTKETGTMDERIVSILNQVHQVKINAVLNTVTKSLGGGTLYGGVSVPMI